MHERVDDLISFKDLADDYDIEWRDGWLLDLQKTLISEGFLRGPSNSMNDDMAIGRLIGRGLQYIEDKHGTLDGVPTMILKRGQEELLISPEQEIAEEITEITGGRVFAGEGSPPLNFEPREGDLYLELAAEPKVESASWTGLPRAGVLDEYASGRVLSALQLADQALEQTGASNHERAQAKAYIVAIRALAEAPDPPADLIWEMVQRVNSIAGIASFFVALVALFGHG